MSSKPRSVLGISAWYHDAAACLLEDGVIVAAAEEERFSRKKHDARFPRNAAAYVLAAGGIAAHEVEAVAFYDKPVRKFGRILDTFMAVAPRGVAAWVHFVPGWLRDKLWVESTLRKELGGYEGKVLFAEHHESHAASAFYPSPFQRAAVLTMDGVGEWATSSIAAGDRASLSMIEELRFPDSLGLLYSAFTYYLGFKVNSGEYKVMGLAPYGEPRFVDAILGKLVDLRTDGSLRLDLSAFGYLTGLRMTRDARWEEIFGVPRRAAEAPLTQEHMDLARSIQFVTEEAMLRMSVHAMDVAGSRNLCLAGGVALNCVGNGRILRDSGCDEIWIQPAAGDSGGALGAALAVWHRYLDGPRDAPARAGDAMSGAFLGPEYGDAEIAAALDALGASSEERTWEELPDRVAELLADGKTCGWFQGRAEFGPRALGSRSILGDPRDRDMQKRLNLQVKYRESFRPFAPAVLEERAAEWFELDRESPYMLLVARVRESKRVASAPEDASLTGLDRLKSRRSQVTAVTHVDFSARVQTVSKRTNALFHALLEAFEKRTGCPMLVNTSFNVRGEPMVLTPQDALACFRRTRLDVLVMGRRIVTREDLPVLVRDEPVGALALD